MFNRPFINLGLMLVFSTFAQVLSAQTVEKPLPADVRLIIDVSGSMKRNDPNNLRQPAVDLLVRLLPEDSKAGVWTFGKYVNMLVPHQVVDDPWKEDAKQKADEINSVGLFTNIGEALERAAHDRKSPSNKYNTSLILLTDGMVDIDKNPETNTKEWKRIVDEVLPELKKAGYTVHTVALSDKADNELLEKIALATDGVAEVAKTADDLMRVFLNAFNVSAPAEQVPLEDNGFVVDSSVEEFTALIFRKEQSENTQLISPDDQTYDASSEAADIAWFRAATYDLVTVKQPLEGEWHVKAEMEPTSRVTVVSDLSLRVKSLPNNVFRHEKLSLTFLLQEEGKTITRNDFLSLLDNSVTMTYRFDDSSPPKEVFNKSFSKNAPPSNGIYKSDLPQLDDLGIYDIQVLVDGKTFQRRFNHRIAVREPFMAKLDERTSETGSKYYLLTVVSHGENIDPQKTQVAASIIKPNRRKIVKPLSLTELQNWQTQFFTDETGEYTVEITVTGTEKTGESFEYKLEPMKVNYDPDADFREPDVVPEPSKPEPEDKPEPEEVVEAEPAEEAVETESDMPPAENILQSLPSWLTYALLGLGNLFLLGGGYFLFKKLMGEGSDEEVLEQFSEEKVQAPQAPPPATEEAPEPEPEEDFDPTILEMDTAEDDEEEPPMEDLEAIHEEMAQKAPEEAEDPEVDLSDDAAFDVPDMEDDESEPEEKAFDDSTSMEEVDDVEEEEPDDFAAEMLKAQGLDLSEEELDDAITNLIDELDGTREEDDEPPKKKPDIDYGDFDFEDDD